MNKLKKRKKRNSGAGCAPGPLHMVLAAGLSMPRCWNGPCFSGSTALLSVRKSPGQSPSTIPYMQVYLPKMVFYSLYRQSIYHSSQTSKLQLKVHFSKGFSFDEGMQFTAYLLFCALLTLQLPPDVLKPTLLRNSLQSVN